jgi:ribosomal protein L13
MVPQNRLKASMLKRLYVFPTEVHTYGDKFKVQAEAK